MSLPITTFEDT
jgi:chromosome segregation ATPase